MTAPGDTLLVERLSRDSHLGELLQGRPVRGAADPYEALLEMGRLPASAVLLPGDNRDLEQLCRALRRLAPAARLLAMCSPAEEPRARSLAGRVLDGYLIGPPTGAELLAALPQPPEKTPASGPTAGLRPHEYVQLLDATRSLAGLEDKILALADARSAEGLVWCDPPQVPPGANVLLRLQTAAGMRCLVPAGAAAPFAPVDPSWFDALQNCLGALVAVSERMESLHRMAVTDHLTGVYNRRYFYHLAEQIVIRARRKDSRLSLLLYDIDNFKRYNDLYGHATGDEILAQTAVLMRRTVRSQDVVARVGGDEFAVLFWDPQGPRRNHSKPPEDAMVLADRFRHAVNELQFPSLGPGAQGSLTISGGLAALGKDGQTVAELMAKADEALIAAKRSGKNAIRIVGP